MRANQGHLANNGARARHCRCALALGLLAVALAPGLWAQSPRFDFQQVSIDQGLSQSSVSCILQDRTGFLWLGTGDGLNKYDGYSFREYRNDPTDPASLSNNRVLCLHEDESGGLWVGTDGGGLNYKPPDQRGFTRYLNDPEDPDSLSHNRVRALHGDGHGNLWIGTGGGGLDRLELRSGRITHYRRNPKDPWAISHNRVRAICADPSGDLWIGTGGGGLNRFDPDTGRFTHFKNDPTNPASIAANQINALLMDRAGNLWIGTYGGGLDRMDGDDANFIHYRARAGDPASLSHDTVNTVFQDRFGQILIGTDAGLDTFDWDQNRFAHFRPRDADVEGGDHITAIFEDRSGVFWVGSESGGALKFIRGARRFLHYRRDPDNPASLSHNEVNALTTDASGGLWIGTGDGLNYMDRNTETFVHYRFDAANPNSLGHNEIFSLLCDREGKLWIGTDGGGLNKFDPQLELFVRYRHDPHDPYSLGDDVVWTLLEDHRGVLWIGTESGLNRYDRDRDRFVRINHDPADPGSLSHNVVWALHEDREQTLWIGTEGGGLDKMLPDGRFRNYYHDPADPGSLSHNLVLSIYQDRAGLLWVGTWGGGLNAFHAETQTFTHYREKDGLPNEVVYGILGDDRGHLWLSSNKGLSDFDPLTEQFRNYDVTDGLQSREFNAGAYHAARDGELYYGGINGFNIFRPGNLSSNGVPPPLAITTFKKFDTLIAGDITGPASFRLPFHDNYLSFEFAALDFTHPERNRYAYQLVGVDKDWVSSGGRRYVGYSGLDPGKYTFQVKGTNNDGLWNENPLAINIRITPPLWRTWWFHILEGLATLGLLVLLFMAQRRRFRQQKAEALIALDLKRKTEELEEARTLQLSLLPHRLPQLAGLKIAVHMETATEVGGDYYDFRHEPDGTLICALGDATGHGVRAGTLVAATKSLFYSLGGNPDPVAFIRTASQALRRMGFPKMFMGLSIAHIKDRTLVMTAAGMPFTLIYRAADGTVEEVVLKGLPLGARDYPYRRRVIDLQAGDMVLMLSDGLEEMFNENNKMFGSAQVRSAFAATGNESPQHVIQALMAAGRSWAAGRPQADDITLLAIKIV